ncbi:MAG TPA: hypothetical protein VIC26_11260 [Marinagarivorans sp.]
MLRQPPDHLLACPNCQANTDGGFSPARQSCSACGQQFFDLQGMPCWFDVGLSQQRLWESLYALAIRSGEHNLERNRQRNLSDMLPSSVRRIQTMDNINNGIVEAMDVLLKDMGLNKTIHPEFANYDPSRMLQYFELLLRDWAWDEARAVAGSENARELERVAAAHAATGKPMGDTWVIGAGAGRLSADLHHALQPRHTVALDTNPVLISCAHRLVAQQRAWQLPEIHPGPQIGIPLTHVWPMQVPDYEPARMATWYAMAGNAWRPPLKKHSFDTIVTPWFMDVNGREVRELIGQVQRYLKPGGVWINTGPLLYGPDITDVHRYSHAEIIELLELAGFKVVYQNHVQSAYLDTPLSEEKRIEQIWTFAATAPDHFPPAYPDTQPPAWIVLPHLPIPADQALNAHGNPVLEHLVAQVDGQTCINDIADIMRPNLAEDKNPLEVVRGAFLEYLLK